MYSDEKEPYKLLSAISQIMKNIINLQNLSLNYERKIPSVYLSKSQISSLYTIHPSGIDIEILSIYIILSLGIIGTITYLCIKYYRKIHEFDFESQIKDLYLTKHSRESTMIENKDKNSLKDGGSLDKTKIQNQICWSETNESETSSHAGANSYSNLEKSKTTQPSILIEEKEEKSKKENEKILKNNEKKQNIQNLSGKSKSHGITPRKNKSKENSPEKSKKLGKKEMIEKKKEKTKKTKKIEKNQTLSKVNLINSNPSITCIDGTDIAIIPQEEIIIPPSSIKDAKNIKKENRSKSKNKKKPKNSPNKARKKTMSNEKLKDFELIESE